MLFKCQIHIVVRNFQLYSYVYNESYFIKEIYTCFETFMVWILVFEFHAIFCDAFSNISIEFSTVMFIIYIIIYIIIYNYYLFI